MKLGVSFVKLGSERVKIFDPERTIIEAFRYLDKETAIKALRFYLQHGAGRKPDIKILTRYAGSNRLDSLQ